MNNKIIKTIFIIFILATQVVLLTQMPGQVAAQVCSGTVRCCYGETVEWKPDNCDPNCSSQDALETYCTPCTDSEKVCASERNEACGFDGLEGCAWPCGGPNGTGTCGKPYFPSYTQTTSTSVTGDDDEVTGTSYTCNQAIHVCVQSSTGLFSSYAACQATCGNPIIGGDPNAGASSCPKIVDNGMAMTEIIYPGTTRTWKTWGAPAGDTAWERLLNGVSSTTPITVNYTAPKDMFVADILVHEPETPFKAFYIYNDDAMAWYFFQGKYQPAVIFTANETIISQLADDAGYTVLSENDTSTPTKRVYRAPNDDPRTWSSTLRNKIPRGVNLIPYETCADAVDADNHVYVRFDSDYTLHDNEIVCIPRGATTYRDAAVEDSLPDGWPLYPSGERYYNIGAYLGMYQDLVVTNTGINNTVGYPGYNPDSRDFDNIFYSILPRKEGGQLRYRNAYFRHALMMIPIQAMIMTPPGEVVDPNDNELYWYVTGDDDIYPVWDASDTEHACLVEETPDKVYVAEETSNKADCSDFIIKDGNDEVQADESLIPGKEYTVSTMATDKSWFVPFFNQNFSQGEIDSTDGWNEVGAIDEFVVIDCGSNCPPNAVDNKSLKYSSVANTAVTDSAITSDWIDTAGNLSGSKVKVEFDMRVDAGARILENTHIVRYPYTDLSTAPYSTYSVAGDVQALQFLDYYLTPSPNIVPTGQWQHFTGVATFPKTVNDSSKLQIVFRGAKFQDHIDNTNVYLDNVVVTTSKQADVKFMARPFSDCATADQVSFDAVPSTGGELFTVEDFSLSQPGTYDLFAEIYDGYSGGCFGHPEYEKDGNSCGLSSYMTQNLTAECADSCSRQIVVEQCVDSPSAPTISSPSSCNSPYNVTIGIPENMRSAAGKKLQVMVYPEGYTINQAWNERMTLNVEYKEIDVDSELASITTQFIASNKVGPITTVAARFAFNNCGNYIESNWTTINRNSECPIEVKVLEKNDPDGACNLSNTVTPNPEVKGTVTFSWKNANLGDPNDSGSQTKTLSNNIIPTPFPKLPYQPTFLWSYIDSRVTLNISDEGVTEDNEYICADCNSVVDDKQCYSELSKVPQDSAEILYVVKANLNYSSWWQTLGGLIFGNNSLSSNIPINDDTLLPNINCQSVNWCNDHAFVDADPAQNPAGSGLFAGIPITNASNINAPEGWWTDRPAQTGAYQASGTSPATAVAQKQDYDYFVELLGSEPESTDTATTFGTMNNGQLGSHEGHVRELIDDEGNNIASSALYHFSPSDGTLTIQLSTWNIPADQQIIILVDGNVKIEQTNREEVGKDSITINPGGFLMVVASGDITFDKYIGYVYSYDAFNDLAKEENKQIEGVFIASDDLIVDTYGESYPDAADNNDRKFVAAGTYVGWDNDPDDGVNGVELRRKFDDGNLGRQKNAVSPVEQFFFRPDLVVNTPDEIRTPDISWEEAN